MDLESKALAGSVPGVIFPDGAKRPFARLKSILAKRWDGVAGEPIKELFFEFADRTLHVSADDEFFSVDRIHLKSLDSLPADIPDLMELGTTPAFSPLCGLDLAAVRWELLAGDIDQFIVLEFKAHKAHHGAADASITIKGDDFHLVLFKGAPTFPDLAFDPDTQACRSI